MSASKELLAQFGPNSAYIEELYALFRQDPALVGDSWCEFFKRFELEVPNGTTPQQNGRALPAPAPTIDATTKDFSTSSINGAYTDTAVSGAVQERVYRMISAFRGRGHFKAQINPLSQGIMPLPNVEDVEIDFYKFSEDQLGKVYACAGLAGQDEMLLKDIIDTLHKTYCGWIGFEFIHLIDQEERLWLQNKIERRFQNGYRLTPAQKLRRLQKIVDAEAFEAELHKKYVGHKRFSLQGSETVIPILDTLLEESGESDIHSVVLGMSHRGRLNVLVNTLGKPLEEVFSEFEDQNIHTALGSGDVKYHMGFESNYISPSGSSLELLLAPNPSHLEFVDPVVQGMVRAIQDFKEDRDRKAVLPVLIHGDAAFIGQGVVTETINLSQVKGYRTGSTVHLIINNQIGFTTNPEESRSCVYCTDMAKAVQAPVFHVNGENVEAACWAVKTALDFRNRYQRDVIIDLYCYRKYGHNEGDDPSFTQPLTYDEIKRKKSIATIYSERLVEENVISEGAIADYYTSFKERFNRAVDINEERTPVGEACAMHGRLRVPTPETGVPYERLEQIAMKLITYPDEFTVHPKLHKILEKRVQTLQDGAGIDWGFAEGLAFGSLLFDGCNVRLSGQDCGRGTFSQRHLLLNDYQGGTKYSPLTTLGEDGATGSFEVINSTLSEAAVLGFEFGYSTMEQNSLVLWEAQFGDFANGAQVIIDQFIASSEAKWHQRSGVVMLLPHGYEGQGPEHSSARLERYLQLCAEGNMVVCYPSSASQYFHLLRRQGMISLKRPVIIMTPKSLLRHAGAACETTDLTSGQFHEVLETDILAGKQEAEHVVFMTGKIYYDVEKALKESSYNVRLVRLEQLYPFPQFHLKKALKDLKAKSYTWVQEEPQNMGAWTYVEPYLRQKFDFDPHYVGRQVNASTATGSSSHHVAEQKQIIADLFAVFDAS